MHSDNKGGVLLSDDPSFSKLPLRASQSQESGGIEFLSSVNHYQEENSTKSYDMVSKDVRAFKNTQGLPFKQRQNTVKQDLDDTDTM